jgi:hypothetical protein
MAAGLYSYDPRFTRPYGLEARQRSTMAKLLDGWLVGGRTKIF